MNRVINNPEEVVEDAVKGLLAAHPDLLAATDNTRVIRAVHAPKARQGRHRHRRRLRP